ncbi:putative pentatricopeptide repeat-containing protein At5g40405 [Mercurialis annua]|uniref:putative pentatricopeptide repeat-containing protein At5g40405 n=1 Tax=Mercurialis annua TaxID=3986 RepID=UPI00215EBB94|nr:putative pentatricopeptide repeat-containing protein At5g40405 [Mercurialis annua]
MFAYKSTPLKTINSRFSTAIFQSIFTSLQANPSLSNIKQTHAKFIISGFSDNPSLMGHLLQFLAQSPSNPFHYSSSIYQTIKNPTVFASNNMIRCFVTSEWPLESVVFYAYMLNNCIRPNNYSFTFLLQACAKGFGLIEGIQVHSHVIKLGFCDDVYVRNALIHLFFGFCRVDCAKKVFDENPFRCDVVTWNAMLAGFGRDGQVCVAEKVFDEMPDRDVISWNTMIMAYVHNGKLEEGLGCFGRMRESGLVPNEATLVTVLSASAQLGLLEHGRMVHSIIDSFNVRMTVALGTALLDMYAKCGCIEQCMVLFDKMPQRDISTWNVMICGLASHGLGKEAIALFEKFLNEGFRPVNITFIGVLNACSRAGLVNEGRHYFNLMTDYYRIQPEMEHFGCIIDLLGRAGLLWEAIKIIETRVASPDPVLWATLLCACRIHGLVELGESIGNRLIESDPTYDGHYVQLASIYAKSKKWEEVARIRKLMPTSKVAGWSLIEAKGRVHRFVAGDRDHESSQQIHEMVEKIETRIAEAGYVANISSVLHDIGEEEKENAIKVHSERLAIAYGFLVMGAEDCIRIVKNLRVCRDCHEVTKMISKVFGREIIVRDVSRFHHFKEGKCSCHDYW